MFIWVAAIVVFYVPNIRGVQMKSLENIGGALACARPGLVP